MYPQRKKEHLFKAVSTHAIDTLVSVRPIIVPRQILSHTVKLEECKIVCKRTLVKGSRFAIVNKHIEFIYFAW